MTDQFKDRHIAIVGMARSGLAAADALRDCGAEVALYDAKPAEELVDALAFAHERSIDAHTSVDEVGRDVDLVITSPGVRRSAHVLTDALARGIPIWGEIEAAYRVSQAPILAITGTNGKTTTVALLGDIVRRAGFTAFVAGNIAAGDIALPLISAARLAKEGDVIVAEISSFQLEWIEAFRPRIAAITNITADHEDRQTPQEYVASKWRIFENQGPGDVAVLRSDVPAPSGSADFGGRGAKVFFDKLARPEWIGDIALPGEHNRENVMTALAMAQAFGIGDDAIRDASLKFSSVVHRMELVASINGVDWYNNSMCTNTDAFARSLKGVNGTKIVLAGGVYKGGDPSRFAEAVADPSVGAVILFGQSAEMLGDVSRTAGARNVQVVSTLQDAFDLAGASAKRGESVLLSPACASFDQFKNFEVRGDRFKAMVMEMASRASDAD